MSKSIHNHAQACYVLILYIMHFSNWVGTIGMLTEINNNNIITDINI